jgi:hypothetical protein
MSTKLEAAMNLVIETQKIADTDLVDVPYKVRPGWGMRINAAKFDLPGVLKEYKEELSKHITKKVFLDGSPEAVAAFARITGELEVDGLVVDASGLYRRLADAVAPSLGVRGEFGMGQYGAISNIMKVIQSEYPEFKLKGPESGTSCFIKTLDQLLDVVRSLVRATNGDALNIHILNARAVKQALAIEQTEPVALFVRGASKDEMANLSLGLIGGPAVLLTIPEDVTTEWVDEELKALTIWNGQSNSTETAEKPKKKSAKKSNQPE